MTVWILTLIMYSGSYGVHSHLIYFRTAEQCEAGRAAFVKDSGFGGSKPGVNRDIFCTKLEGVITP